ncbi:MAG: hypothetical protein IT348_02185 [Candidatus Eisenbacteria bacterium]|nr:hypothetical protein [Candidatus Eisenbacteria bacterium]
MSAFWASSVARRVLPALLLVTFAVPALAKVTIKSAADSGRAVSRITISGDGVEVVDDSRQGTRVRIAADIDSLGVGSILVDEGSGIVRFLSDAEVKAGERVDGDVVTIAGNIKVAGEVTGAVVSVFGGVTLAPGAIVGGDAVAVLGSVRSAGQVTGSTVAVLGSARLDDGGTVGGDAVSVGGAVEESDSTRIAGQSVSLQFLPLTLGMPILPTVIGFIVLGWLLTLLFGWVFASLFPERLKRIAVTSSRRTFLSIVVAVLALLAWPVVSLLLIFTLIGAPIGVMLWILFPVASYAGQLAATYVLGCKLLRRRLGEGGALAPIMAGSTLLALFFVAGALLWTLPGLPTAVALFLFLVALLMKVGLTTIGVGALLLSRLGVLPRDIGAASAPADGAPPAA